MAGIDTSIYNFQPVRLRDPLETAANALQVQSAQQANQLNALKQRYLEEDRANQLADEAIQREYFGRGGGEQNIDVLNARPRVRVAEEKRLLDKRKELSGVNKTEGETLDAALKRYRSALDFIDTPDGAARWYAAQYQDPALKSFVERTLGPAQGAIGSIPADPQAFQEWRQKVSMGLDKFMDNQRQAMNQKIVIGPDGKPMVNRALVEAEKEIAQAGQPITYGSPVPVVLPGGNQGLVQPPTRSGGDFRVVTLPDPNNPTRRIPLPPVKEGAMTEGQANASLYATRMQEADKVINNLEGKYNRTWLAARQAVGDGMAGTVANSRLPAEAQQVDQAQRDFINAVLRRESGAVISPEEFSNARRQYFPQPGDSDEVVRQKAANRRTAIEGIRAAAGQGAPVNKQQKSQPQEAGTPSVNDLLKKYGG